jgi:hypothetical protein
MEESQLLKKFPEYCESQKFIAVFTKTLPLVPIVSHINPVYTLPSYLLNIHFNIILQPTTTSSIWSISLHVFISRVFIANLREGEMLEDHKANGRTQLMVSKPVLVAQSFFGDRNILYAFLFSPIRAIYPVTHSL